MTDGPTRLASLSNLTTSQLLIWTGQRLQPDDPLYNMILSFRIRGPLDPALFRAAWQALVDRCDALRAVIEMRDGVPWQRFVDGMQATVPVVDLSADPSPQDALTRWLDAHRGHRFDLATGLTESVLIRLSADDHVWYLNQHHVMTDAWAVGVIYRTLQSFYGLAREGRLAEAPDLPAYADFAAREKARRDSPAQARNRRYWTDRLREEFLPSTFYRRPPADRSGQTVRVPCPLGAKRSAAIRALAQQDGYRAFSSDLAHFQIFATVLFAWLRRVSGHTRLSLGTPSHNRATALDKDTVGLFIELFPLSVSADDTDSFRTLLGKVAANTQQLLLHAAPGATGFGSSRAFDVVLNFITASFGDFAGLPMQSEWVHAGYGDRNHLLRLQVQDFDRSDEFGLYFDLNGDSFDTAERGWAVEHYLTLLDAFLADPEQAVDSVPLTRPAQYAELIDNGPVTPAPAQTVVALFEAQARATPDATALVCGDRTMGYRELDTLSARLAARLARDGAAAGSRIAVCMTRSPEAVIAILGVLRTGAAYVPIDPGNPDRRIAGLIEASGSNLVITQPALEPRMPPGVSLLALTPELAASLPPPGSTDPAAGTPTPRDVAYVMYTSGSTGRPKGVVVGHDGLANYIAWARRQYAGSGPTAFALYSSLGFDLTVTSLFVPLISGGRLVIYPEDPQGREITIRRVIEDNAVDVIKLTPVHLALIQGMDLSASRLSTLVVGGEDFKRGLAATIARRFGGEIALYNEYGPTEGTVACMIHRYRPATDTGASVPIGRAIDNLGVYVLDRYDHPVPRGVAGQICIGGAGVARGYLDDAAATRARFVPDPFRSGATMYRTGDLARWNSRGVLEYLGREDHQVKIRGVRVETAEVEAALLACEGVTDCVVDVVRQQAPVADDTAFCLECGLSSAHPDAHLDADRVCRICRAYAAERDKAGAYFGAMDTLVEIARQARAGATGGGPDSMMLLSGGKDSTYALCRLVDLGLKPLVFSLDNGFISEDAKANIRRVVDRLGLELVTGTTPAMNEIFADSLTRHSNVCQGCFKTIYTLSMNLAHERGIRHIFTGLSRGQIFETRLADLFKARIYDPEQIDRTIVEARKAYHRMDDAVSRCLDVSLFKDDAVFEQIRFVDFYRYCDVTLDEMLGYLATEAPWIRPRDTGRSTNCLINEAGIHVHKTERGFHNYSLPYSWDVRLGHKERDAAREELDDRIDPDNVRRILEQVGYRIHEPAPVAADARLAAWYVAEAGTDEAALKAHVAALLPAEFRPAAYVRLEALPQTPNGKVDRARLPEPGDARPDLPTTFVEPAGETETALASIWAGFLGVDRVGRDDNFFDLGGDSIINIQIVARARAAGLILTPQQIFEHPTIAGLAAVTMTRAPTRADQGIVTGEAPLTPIQRRFFDAAPDRPERFCQHVLLEMPASLSTDTLREGLAKLLAHHDGLRSRFVNEGGRWRRLLAADAAVDLDETDLSALPESAHLEQAQGVVDGLDRRFDLDAGRLTAATRFRRGPGHDDWLAIAIHHLVVDGVSWWILLQDLDRVCRGGGQPTLPAKTSSVIQWAGALQDFAASDRLQPALDYWTEPRPAGGRLPQDHPDGGPNDRASARRVEVALASKPTRQLLQEVPAAHRVQVPDVLLAALGQTLAGWTGSTELGIDLEGHGREAVAADIDVLRTVGWFTSVFPLTLSMPAAPDPVDALRRVKEQLRTVPDRGMSYGVLRYLADAPTRARLQSTPEPQVLFNYMGQWDRAAAADAIFRFVRPIGASLAGLPRRDHLLEIDAVVFDGRLRIGFSYSANRHDEATIEALADRYLANLTESISRCLAADHQAWTPSDFPDADLDQQDLDSLLADFGE